MLFRKLATIVVDCEVGSVDSWRWNGPTERFKSVAADLGAPNLAERADRIRSA
jgi:hypothetical protein